MAVVEPMSRSEILIQLGKILAIVLEGKEIRLEEIDPSRSLYEDGYGLNSMDTATFAAMLSEEFSSDPYMAGEIPQNLGEIADYYNRIQA
jgi:acyl carrier protein